MCPLGVQPPGFWLYVKKEEQDSVTSGIISRMIYRWYKPWWQRVNKLWIQNICMMSAKDLAILKGEVEGLKLALPKKEKEAEATAENLGAVEQGLKQLLKQWKDECEGREHSLCDTILVNLNDVNYNHTWLISVVRTAYFYMHRVFVICRGWRWMSGTKKHNILTFNKQLASFKNNTCTLSAEPYPLAFKEEVWGYTSKTHVGKDPENFRSRASSWQNGHTE